MGFFFSFYNLIQICDGMFPSKNFTCYILGGGFVFVQVYVVYMGSRGSDEDPDEILRQNHQMLTSIQQGRSISSSSSLFVCGRLYFEV